MPNYIANVLKIKNIKSIPELIGADENVVMDFNKIIPMPDALDQTHAPENSNKDLAIVYYLTERCTILLNKLSKEKQAIIQATVTNLFDPNWAKNVFHRAYEQSLENSTYQNRRLYELGQLYVENFQNYGATTWYDWCNTNWNTKWNASSYGLTDNDKNALYFETAWDAPYPILIALSSKHPDIEMELFWADEDRGCHTGRAVFYNGVCVNHIDYENNSKSAQDNCNWCWSQEPRRKS